LTLSVSGDDILPGTPHHKLLLGARVKVGINHRQE
jgi:hypothetical protein